MGSLQADGPFNRAVCGEVVRVRLKAGTNDWARLENRKGYLPILDTVGEATFDTVEYPPEKEDACDCPEGKRGAQPQPTRPIPCAVAASRSGHGSVQLDGESGAACQESHDTQKKANSGIIEQDR